MIFILMNIRQFGIGSYPVSVTFILFDWIYYIVIITKYSSSTYFDPLETYKIFFTGLFGARLDKRVDSKHVANVKDLINVTTINGMHAVQNGGYVMSLI